MQPGTTLLIDGNNLWYAAMHRGHPLAGIARRDFVRVLDRFARGSGRRVLVVLDGHRPASVAAQTEPRGGAERVYAGGEPADTVIARRVDQSSEPRRLTVVSSDRSLLRQVRKRRVKVIESEAFAARLETWLNRPTARSGGREPAGKQSGLGGVAESIDQWLKFLDLPPAQSDIMGGEREPGREPSRPGPGRAGSNEAGGGSQSGRTSDSSPSPSVEQNGLVAREDLGRVLGDVQPLKRRKSRRRQRGRKGADRCRPP